jgi:predicted nucleic acid-binding protein
MPVLIDTGPLVALLVTRERHHNWSAQLVAQLEPPLYTCDAVIAEACFLVRRLERGADAVLSLLATGALKLGLTLTHELEPVRRLMQRYANVPMSLADACLVRMSETIPGAQILTFDTDFVVYRRNRRQPLKLITPQSK